MKFALRTDGQRCSPTLHWQSCKLTYYRVTQLNNNLYIGRRADVPDDFPLEWVNFSRPMYGCVRTRTLSCTDTSIRGETVLRRLARKEPKIEFIHGFVTGLLPSKEGDRTVKGVTYRPNSTDGSGSEIDLDATLVIDATGAACRGEA